MINPLQAMAQSRAANQNLTGGIQPVGATDPRLSLQRQQLNVPTTGQRMDGRASEMVAVDPYMYVDRKQQRDFTAINQERQRQANALENQRSREAQIQAATVLNERTRQNQLDQEERIRIQAEEQRRLQAKAKIDNQNALNALADERFAQVRAPAGEAIARHSNWFLEGGRDLFNQDTFKRYFNSYAMKVDDQSVQDAYKAKLGYEPKAPLKKTDPNYLTYATEVLNSTPELFTSAVEESRKSALAETNARSKIISSNQQNVISFMTKTGMSPMAPTTPLSPETLPPADLGSLPVPDAVEGLPPPKVSEDPSSPYYLENALNAGLSAVSGGVDALSNNAGNTAAVLGGGTVLNAVTTKGDDVVEEAFKANKKGLDGKELMKTSKTMKEAKATKLAAFKNLAKASGSSIPSDDEIIKMKPAEIKKYVEDKRRGIIGRVYGRIKMKPPSNLLKAIAKGGAVVATVFAIKDLATALTPQEKAELQATDEIVLAQNAPSQAGTSGGVGWRRK